MNLDAKLDAVLRRNEELTQLISTHSDPGSDAYTSMLKELADMGPANRNNIRF